jgi:hypothetical protein
MWWPDLLVALGAVAGALSGLTALIILHRFWVRAKSKGAMNRDDFRRTIVRMCFLGLGYGLAFALFASGMWVDSVEAFPPESSESYVEGAFSGAYCFVGSIGLWLLAMAGTASALRGRLPWDNGSEPTP